MEGVEYRTGTISSAPDQDDLSRIRYIKGEVANLLPGIDLIVVEGLAYRSLTGHSSTRSGLWWMVMDLLNAANSELIVCTPTKLKKFATGKGNAGKDKMMLATARTFSEFDGDNNQADALWLASYGLTAIGVCELVEPTAYRLEAVGRK